MTRQNCTPTPDGGYSPILEALFPLEETVAISVQWNPYKADNLEPHISPIIVGCPLWRGCIGGKTIGTQKFVRYIEVSVIEGCPLSRVPL